MPYRPGTGRPYFGKVHTLRQRRAMHRLLCQVCGGPADSSGEGVLWLLDGTPVDGDGDGARDGTSGHATITEGERTCQPPVCLPCARRAVRACPHLRGRFLAARVARPVLAGVYGALYRSEPLRAEPVQALILGREDPRMPWLRASQLVRGLHGCTMVDLAAL